MQTIELLAPAKNLETGIAAIDHGADAVYIGAAHHGARANAANSIEDIKTLCEYAHKFMARVYVTINTIVYDDEIEGIRQLLCQLSKVHVDAILVQDMAIVKMVNDADDSDTLAYYKGRMHASTQTDNRHAEKVAWLRDCGMARVVLARELSLDEISSIHRQVPDVELEAFVHGALCVSYSGLCYASQCCMGRSANRGECAQVCRMKFDLVDDNGDMIVSGRHLLSLKDMCQIDNLEKLLEAGVVSFKIEGRLKDITYVKNVVAAYNQRIEQIVAHNPGKYRRASLGRCHYSFTPDLQKTFNRGYTSYFINGRQQGISSPETPKAKGKPVGKVKDIRRNFLTIAGVESFANGDGLCYIGNNGDLEGFRVNRVEGNKIFPHKMPTDLRTGMTVFRNNDKQFESALTGKSAERKIDISMHLHSMPHGLALTALCHGADSVTVTMDIEKVEAKKPQHDNIVTQLSKLGSTVYSDYDITVDDDVCSMFIPSSRLSDLRRAMADALDKMLAEKSMHAHTAPCDRQQGSKDKLPVGIYGSSHYLYNIANGVARDFYIANGLTSPGSAYERTRIPGATVMQCRHCIRFALGHCVKNGGTKPTWKEPLTLVLENNKRFGVVFDCKHCQMNVYDKNS